ncbi:MAG: hypothetical protein HYX32_07180 [Actinobacteria bacterium]|nr:hypothetical protein [Actinomycetota bacterium]
MAASETDVDDASDRVTNAGLRRALLVATAIVVAIWLALILFWQESPFALTFDDAWYYLTIGRNLNSGRGSTFDGINLTNGYHPLWQLVSVLPFTVGLDDLAAARALLVLQLLVGWGLTLALLSATVARLLADWPPARRRGPMPGAANVGSVTLAATLVLFAGSPFIVKVFVNGLESGIAATVDSALLYVAIRQRGRWLVGTSARGRLGVSLLLALAFLARTDAAFLLASLGIWCVAEALTARPPKAIVRLAQLFALPAVVIVAYLAANQRLFGTPFQISGLVKRVDPLRATTVIVFALFVAAAIAAGRFAFRSTGSSRGRFPAAATFVRHTGWFAAFCVVLVGYYSVLQVQQWLWYYAPIVLYLTGLLLLGVADMVGASLRDAPERASAERAVAPVQAMLALLLGGLLAFASVQFFDPNVRSIQIANADAGVWMRANLPEGSRIASWDAGALGYFSHRDVINIDGVVNSYRYYELGRTGQGKTFWACSGLGYVANLGGDANGDDPDIRSFIAGAVDPAAAKAATVIFTRPFTYSGVLSSTGGSKSVSSEDLAVRVYALAPLSGGAASGCP